MWGRDIRWNRGRSKLQRLAKLAQRGSDKHFFFPPVSSLLPTYGTLVGTAAGRERRGGGARSPMQ